MSEDSDDSSKETADSIRTVPPDADPVEFSRALAAQIGDRNIWIANSGGVAPAHLETMGLDPDFVVSVSQAATEVTTDHHPLKDGYVNDQDQFTEAIDAARHRLSDEGTIIVNCAAGISRSTTVAATALAAEEDLRFNTVVEEIKETRPRARPHPKLQLNALAYLATVEDRNTARRQFEQMPEDTPIGRSDEDVIEKVFSSDSS